MKSGDFVKIIGDSVFGFSDRYGEIARIIEIQGNKVVVQSRDGSMTDLYLLSSIAPVAC
jgi:hypothetical protein